MENPTKKARLTDPVENNWIDNLDFLVSPNNHIDDVDHDIDTLSPQSTLDIPLTFGSERRYMSILRKHLFDQLICIIQASMTKHSTSSAIIESVPWENRQRTGIFDLRLEPLPPGNEVNSNHLFLLKLTDPVTSNRRLNLLGTIHTVPPPSKYTHFRFFSLNDSTHVVLDLLRSYKGRRCGIGDIGSIITTRREYESLRSFPLLNPRIKKFILNPSSEYNKMKPPETDPSLSKFIQKHMKNKYDERQFEAISKAVYDHELPFTLIQGPPGTGKTHTIIGILNMCHLVDHQTHRQKMKETIVQGIKSKTGFRDIHWPTKPRFLVSAPSNAATDDILRKLLGVGLVDGQTLDRYYPRVVRIGFNSQMEDAKKVGLEAKSKTYIMRTDDEVSLEIKRYKKRVASSNRIIDSILKKCSVEGRLPSDGELNKLCSEINNRYKHEVELCRYNLVEQIHRGTSFGNSDLEVTFLEEASIIFTTVSGCKERCLQSLKNNEFDLVIIDEAGQVHEAGVLPALGVKAKRFVLVGDPQQLPATILSQNAKNYHFDRSLFERLQLGGYPTLLLSTQYRMHPHISRFPSMHFYKGQLKDSDLVRSREELPFLTPYMFYNVIGEEQKPGSLTSSSFFNEKESAVCLELYKELQEVMKRYGHNDELRVGVITPYTKQVECLKQRFVEYLTEEALKNICFATIDAFQGQERDVIILSCVRTKNLGFVSDIRRMNVALTRAKRALWVVGKKETLTRSKDWKALIDEAGRRNFCQDC